MLNSIMTAQGISIVDQSNEALLCWMPTSYADMSNLEYN